MKTTKHKLSRLDFLKNTGIIATGLAFFPGHVSANLKLSSMGSTIATGAALSLKIFISKQAKPIEKQAAQQLQKYLLTLPGAKVELLEEDQAKEGLAIYVGQTNFSKSKNIDFNSIEEDGYLSKIDGDQIILVGGSKSGVLYGAYDLLEELGFKRFGANESFLPNTPSIILPKKEKLFNPKIKYRTTSYSQMAQQEYSDWHKLSSRDDWGLFVHTLDALVPAKKYAKAHPEYYSLIEGVRRPGTQLCLSNPEVLQVLTDNLKIKIAEKPNAIYWSVSQDDNDRYCACDNCKALNVKYGGVPSGSIIWFVNQVAKAFPNKIISTLAYWYSRKAPKNIQIEPNVNIMLCNIESSREAPVFVTDKAFSNDLKDWGALSKDILIWDYNIQFTNFVSPFPNLFTIQPNIKFYTDNNVNALFMQANNEPAAEMALLRSYLISKCMWNPALDANDVMNEFINGYFGAAGIFIRKYIDSMQAALQKSKMKLSIFGDPIHAKEAYLSSTMLPSYNVLFDQAEKAVANNPAMLQRVQTARLPLMYAAIQIGRTEIDTARSMYYTKANGNIAVRPAMKTLVSTFVNRCLNEKIKLLRERAGTPQHYLSSYERIFSNMDVVEKALSFKKKIIPITVAAEKSKPFQSLTEGVFASFESWQEPDQNWVYATGTHMEFILDLGKETNVNAINMDFLNPQAQPDWHLFALPKYVSYSLSLDGEKYEEAIVINNPNNPNPIENPDVKLISFLSFTQTFKTKTKTRFIKVHAESLLKTPSWHIRSGSPLSIYCDQIVVK
ncbi:MAG: DUF4838 domain-containing protein [Chitinophagia bacterium]|jgi:hypothetical protein